MPPRPAASPFLRATFAALLLAPLPAGPTDTTGTARAAQEMPGALRNAPPQASGFPIPYFRTADYRTRIGAVVPADVDRDGAMEIVVTIPSGLVTVIGRGGAVRPGWPRTFETLEQPAYPLGAPAAGDLDGDGRDEIVACVLAGPGGASSRLFAFGDDGADLPGWPVALDGACAATSVLLADFDGDGASEIAHALSDGTIAAFDGDGRPLPGWPHRLGPDASGRLRAVNAELTASDLDGDGSDDLVLVESGLGPRLAAISGAGRMLPGFPQRLPEVTELQAPAAADLDGDGRPEIVQSTQPFVGDTIAEPVALAKPDPTEPAIPAALRVLRADGTAVPGWPVGLAEGAAWGAVVTDLTGDGTPEILQQDGDLLAGFDVSGSPLPGFPIDLRRELKRSQSLERSPWSVADLNADGAADLLQLQGNLYAGGTILRVFGIRNGGHSLRGFPFDAEGLLAASRPAVLDLSG
ncbi:MAG: FG-GAP repeat domain-containing protein, partial [Candidatus Polarisedimenticolia bacterium]